jgi:hypothetical protein
MFEPQKTAAKEAFAMWWAYHKKWGTRWFQAVLPRAREHMVGACAASIGAIVGWRYLHLTKSQAWSAVIIGVAGYGVIMLVYSVLVALFQSSRIDHEQENEIATLAQQVEIKTQDWISVKEETLAEMREHCKTQKELVDALAELGKARTTAANNSNAFHEQYAEVNRLRGELAEWRDVNVKDTDPQIYAEFNDDRGRTPKKESELYITLVNRGQSEALNVCIDPLSVAGHIINFRCLAYSISPNRSTFRYPDITTNENESADYYHQDIFGLLWSEYSSLGDLTIPELVLTLTINYQDKARNLYQATCDLVFDPSAHLRVRTGGQNGSIKVAYTQNHKFTKLAIAAK